MIQPPADHGLGKAHLVRARVCVQGQQGRHAAPVPALGPARGGLQRSRRPPSHPYHTLLAYTHQMHYTWGSIFKDAGGAELWQFDKRAYTDAKHEREVRLGGVCRWPVELGAV